MTIKHVSTIARDDCGISRRSLIAAGAAAGSAVALGATDALGADAEVAELRRLIAEHKTALEAHDAADERSVEIRRAYKEAHRDAGRVPVHLNGSPAYHEIWLDRAEIEKKIREQYERKREYLGPFLHAAPEYREELEAVNDAKMKEHLAVMDRCFAEEEARQGAFGVAAAENEMEEAWGVVSRLAATIVDFPCTTMEALRLKAAWFHEWWLQDEDETTQRFVANIAGTAA